mgnify:FL=1|jgi:hypothetical protein
MAYNKSPFKMAGKSPLMKQLIGKQSTLPEGLQAAIKASPAKKYGHSPAKQSDNEVKAQEAPKEFKGQKTMKSSPVKQVKVKDLPKKAVETGEKIVQGVKDIGKKIGNITLSSKERQDCKKAGGRFKKGTCYMPQEKKDKSSK